MRLLNHKRRRPRDARDALLFEMARGGVCAEIGVFRGDFSERILRVAKPRRLHLIDPWKFEPNATYEKSLYGRGYAGGQAKMDAIYDSVRERFDHHIRNGTVVIHRTSSAEAANQFDDGYFDWIYIDGNHLHEFVLGDLETYYPKVKPGGCITGDDYGFEGWWKDGVTRAVDEFTERYGCQKVFFRRGQYVLRKKKSLTAKVLSAIGLNLISTK
jgi:Methyltransferase domain